MLERMESMAGRIVANELMAVAETDGYGSFPFVFLGDSNCEMFRRGVRKREILRAQTLPIPCFC